MASTTGIDDRAAPRRLGSVLIVDDHPLYRTGLKAALGPLVLECCEASSLSAAIDVLAERRFDLILYDWHLPDGGGCRGLVAVCQLASKAPVVVITADEDDAIGMAAASIGAADHLSKATDAAALRDRVGRVLAGAPAAPSRSIPPPVPKALTQRQRDVLQWMARGDPNKRIADRLGIAETTVRAHVSSILQLMRVRNRTEAVIQAQRERMLGPSA